MNDSDGRSALIELLLGMGVSQDGALVLCDDLDSEEADRVELAWETIRHVLCPPTCKGEVSDEFWASMAGQYVADALWRIYESQAVNLSEAIRVLRGNGATLATANYAWLRNVLRAAGRSVYRKPDSALRPGMVIGMRAQGRANPMGPGAHYVLRSHLEDIMRTMKGKANDGSR